MPFSTPATAEQMRLFKGAANGLSGRQAGEAMVRAILKFYKGEITVMDRYGIGELFRIGAGDRPMHGISGVHIHPATFHGLDWRNVAHKDAVPMTDENYNRHVGLLLQALETGCYRAGFKFR